MKKNFDLGYDQILSYSHTGCLQSRKSVSANDIMTLSFYVIFNILLYSIYILYTLTLITGGRSDRCHTGRRSEGQVADGVLDGRQMLHDIRQRRVLGTGAAHGVQCP